MNSVSFYITCGTIVLLALMVIYIATAKKKKILHYLLLLSILAMFIWNSAMILRGVFHENKELYVVFENLTYLGSALIPVMLILIGVAYAQPEKGVRKWHFLLFIVPVVTQFILWTNDSHHLFTGDFVLNNGEYTPISYGIYAYIHIAYSYICILIGIGYLSFFAIKNSGVWSAQAILIIIGSIIPLVTNVLYTMENVGIIDIGINAYASPIAFSSTLGLYLLGMFRFSFLRIAPVALQTVINRISDSFIVVDTEMNIIDFNKPFESNFKMLQGLQKGSNFYKMLSEVQNDAVQSGSVCSMKSSQFRDMILSAAQENDTLITDFELSEDDVIQYYTAEFTPIQQRSRNTAVVVLIKNVTQHIKDMQQIQDNQSILLERERLASLGQLIGGIAHNLKTPIMSVAGGIEQIKFLTEEYETSVDDPEVTSEDHKEIAAEIKDWLSKMKVHMTYMSDIISTVKDQATNFASSGKDWFTLDEVLKRVKILMHHEITKNHCRYIEDIQADRYLKIEGGINSMVQILDNIIVNAVQAYGKKGGDIILRITPDSKKLHIVISDFAKGIKDEVKSRLFKEMITTKGKNGTGLGLYMSYSTIKGMFRGDMWVESTVGVGTDFHIKLPLYDESKDEEDDMRTENFNDKKQEFSEELTGVYEDA